jgi:hypothetical protein
MVGEATSGIGGLWEMLRVGAGPAAFTVLYALFAKLEDMASPAAKRDIAAWLNRAEIPGTLVNWPSQFVALFDRVFGKRHLSLRCFLPVLPRLIGRYSDDDAGVGHPPPRNERAVPPGVLHPETMAQ